MSASFTHCFSAPYACQGIVVDCTERILVRHKQEPGFSMVMFDGSSYVPLVELEEKSVFFSLQCRDIFQQLSPGTLLTVRKEDQAILLKHWVNAKPIGDGMRIAY